jgi:predicted nucleic acid-binding protein
MKEEDEAATVQKFIDEARSGNIVLRMSIVNILEVRYGFLKYYEQKKFDNIWQQIKELPIQWVRSINDDVLSEAARIKDAYRVPIGDSIGLATAIVHGGKFLTKDTGDFQQIDEAEPGLVEWLRT